MTQDATAEAREQIARALATIPTPPGAVWPLPRREIADAVLAVPAVAEALAAVERVRALLIGWDDASANGLAFTPNDLRRALDGGA